MNNNISTYRSQPRIVYLLAPLMALLVIDFLWASFSARPMFALRLWAIAEVPLNTLWQKHLLLWKYVFLGLLLANVLLLELWFTSQRSLSNYLKGNIKHPQKQLQSEIKQLSRENSDIKQKLKVATMDLSLSKKTSDSEQRQQWVLIRHELETQLAQANSNHEKTRQAFSELQIKADELTMQVEQSRKNPSTDPIVSARPQGKQSDKLGATLKNLKEFIDRNDLA